MIKITETKYDETSIQNKFNCKKEQKATYLGLYFHINLNLKYQKLIYIIITIIYPMNRKQYAFPRDREDSPKNGRAKRYDVDPHKQRVAQTNMVYLIGLPESIADEHLLSLESYCGQYGKITKVLVKKNFINDFSSYSAYITYEVQQSASIAIIGLNNLIFEKNRIYASYGTNKYCSTFIRFGKCRKQDCPFLHKIQKDKEIRQEDNKKLFQQQQESARKYILQNHSHMDFTQLKAAIFPSKYQIRQELIDEGFIKIPKEEKPISKQVITRENAMKQTLEHCSEGSTQCSPLKDTEQNQIQTNESKIIKRITKKVKLTKSSLFNFAKQKSSDEFEFVTNQLKDYILESMI